MSEREDDYEELKVAADRTERAKADFERAQTYYIQARVIQESKQKRWFEKYVKSTACDTAAEQKRG